MAVKSEGESAVLTKKQAAERLGVTVRAIERYQAHGKLTASHRHGKYGSEAIYPVEQIEAIEREREQPVSPTPPTPRQSAATSELQLVKSVLAREHSLLADFIETYCSLLPPPTPSDSGKAVAPLSELAHKLILSTREAASLAGVPIDRIRTACADGSLRAQRDTIRRGWAIRRVDIEAWVDELFAPQSKASTKRQK